MLLLNLTTPDTNKGKIDQAQTWTFPSTYNYGSAADYDNNKATGTWEASGSPLSADIDMQYVGETSYTTDVTIQVSLIDKDSTGVDGIYVDYYFGLEHIAATAESSYGGFISYDPDVSQTGHTLAVAESEEDPACGTGCIIGAVLGSVFGVAVIVGLVLRHKHMNHPKKALEVNHTHHFWNINHHCVRVACACNLPPVGSISPNYTTSIIVVHVK